MTDDKRTPQDAKRVMDETLRRMLATRPQPQATPKSKPNAKKRK